MANVDATASASCSIGAFTCYSHIVSQWETSQANCDDCLITILVWPRSISIDFPHSFRLDACQDDWISDFGSDDG